METKNSKQRDQSAGSSDSFIRHKTKKTQRSRSRSKSDEPSHKYSDRHDTKATKHVGRKVDRDVDDRYKNDLYVSDEERKPRMSFQEKVLMKRA